MKVALEALKIRKKAVADKIVRLERDPINNSEELNSVWDDMYKVRKDIGYYEDLLKLEEEGKVNLRFLSGGGRL